MLGEQTQVSALAYLAILILPALAVRWFIKDAEWFGPLARTLFGPALMVAVMVLSVFKPITVEDESGEPQTVTPHVLAGKAADALVGGKDADGKGGDTDGKTGLKPLGEPPPGVKYTPADPDEEVTLDSALKELNELIGLKEVKAEVEKFAKFVQVSKQRQAAGLKVAPISYHMVFTGNPGTGKTTVARIMAKIYRALGVVKRGHMVETDRGGLIAEYVGQTAVKTGQVIDFALGGVLFIDEAYSITENDGKQGYGGECIATLLKRMEDDRDNLVVIVAGYTDEMKRFIDANPGLESRFNRYINFPDYTPEELADIYRMHAAKSQYRLSADVERWLAPYIYTRTKERNRKFGNGRWVRNEFEKAVERQALRLADIENPTREQLMTLTMKDVGILLKDRDASDED